MDLIFWRHAEAEPGDPDALRHLTPKGVEQAAYMGTCLKKYLPANIHILVSPTLRTRETADALMLDYTLCESLAQGKSSEELLQAVGWPNDQRPVLVVGHQPAFGRSISLLMTGSESDWAIDKAAFWWLKHEATEDEPGVIIKAVMSPEFLRK